MQSPIGLVPKAGGKTRLIFHLSYQFHDGLGSLNQHTPEELCHVHYNDLDHTVANCLKLLRLTQSTYKIIFFGKTDIQSAFRLVPLRPDQLQWLISKVTHPITKIIYYFIDKCLPFGASISCAIFQAFSYALRHLLEWRTKMSNNITNYLDDYLFLAYTLALCNWMIEQFLALCEEIGCPINGDKTRVGYHKNSLFGHSFGWTNSYAQYTRREEKQSFDIFETHSGKQKGDYQAHPTINRHSEFFNLSDFCRKNLH